MTAVRLASELIFEDREAARLAGVEQGLAERVDLAIEDRARELLADWARDWQRMAKREALQRHGPAWSALIRESGERP